jgi:glycosyltransferase involved in cell wall biosynthesis
VVPNAVDVSRWRDAVPDPSLANLRRPRVGYAGSLQARVDGGLIGRLATLVPEATFVIAGRAMSAFWHHPLGLPANVRLIGNVPFPRMPAVLAAMDACIVPHVVDGFTASMDPLKLYEYLAAGRPVVSTVASPNPRLAPHVRVARGAAAMADALREEIDGDSPAKREARRGAVAGDTWDARAATVIETLERLL